VYDSPLLLPPAVVTVMPTDPAEVPAGTTTSIWLSETMVGVALLAPKATLEAVASPLPVMATVFPPAVGPEVVLTAALNGAPR
jgi:hypothetical protein